MVVVVAEVVVAVKTFSGSQISTGNNNLWHHLKPYLHNRTLSILKIAGVCRTCVAFKPHI